MTNFCFVFFFFKQKTAYEMRISDWSSDVCSSDLPGRAWATGRHLPRRPRRAPLAEAAGELFLSRAAAAVRRIALHGLRGDEGRWGRALGHQCRRTRDQDRKSVV